MVAEAWLKQLKKIFAALGCTGEQKVVFATFVLQGDADEWWEAKVRLLNAVREEEPITWEQFEEAFLDKYFPQGVRDNMEAKFIWLEQGGKSVMEYEKEFTSLSRFVPMIVSNEHSKCRKFQEGLRPIIKSRLSALRITEYTDLVERAVIVERDLMESQKVREQQLRRGSTSRDPRGRGFGVCPTLGWRGRGGSLSAGIIKPFGIPRPRGPIGFRPMIPRPPPPCGRCGQLHTGLCSTDHRNCYACGKPGHIVVACPTRRMIDRGKGLEP